MPFLHTSRMKEKQRARKHPHIYGGLWRNNDVELGTLPNSTEADRVAGSTRSRAATNDMALRINITIILTQKS